MVTENYIMKTAEIIKENFKMIRSMVKAVILGIMAKDMMEGGKTESNMEKALSKLLQVIQKWEYGTTANE